MNLFPDNAIASELAENGKGLIGKIKTDFPYVNAQDKAYFQPVSYTHLDVYKRQISYIPDTHGSYAG